MLWSSRGDSMLRILLDDVFAPPGGVPSFSKGVLCLGCNNRHCEYLTFGSCVLIYFAQSMLSV
jgi:hypothetical protein